MENNKSIFTGYYGIKEDINIPIAHGEGNFYCNDETLTELLANNQILFTYNQNPNGSVRSIAGIQNKGRNILGMMPHPERAADEKLDNTDGLRLLRGVADSFQ